MTDKSSQLDRLRIDRSTAPRPRRSWAWWVIGAVVIVAVAAGGWYAFDGGDSVKIHAVAARAATGTATTAGASLLDASGYVVARREATVSAKIAGKLAEVLIEEGQRVAKDEVIARLDDSNYRAALDQARAQAEQAAASLAAARTNEADARPTFLRNQQQLAEGLISKETFEASQASFDAARTNAIVAERTLTVAQAALNVAQRNWDDTVVHAPFAGVVTVKAAQPGEIVSPLSSGGFTRTGVATIVDMDSLEVEVDVSENFIHRVEPAQPVTIKLNAYPEWQIKGEVIAVIPTADRAKATVKVRVAFKERDPRILPEMGARVSFLSTAAPTSSSAPAGVVVPGDAVEASGDTGVVFVIRGNKVERRAVRLGGSGSAGQTVVSGLTAGERVAIGDLTRLHDGATISLVE